MSAKEKKYFRLVCVSKDRVDKITKDDIALLLNSAAAIYGYKETVVIDSDRFVIGQIDNEGTLEITNPYCTHFMDAFSDYEENEERVGYLGRAMRVASVKTLLDIPKDVKNPPVFFKIESCSDARHVTSCVYATRDEDGVRTPIGIIDDNCNEDRCVWAHVYTVENSDHIVQYSNIDSTDKDAPITYKNVLIDTTDKSRRPIKFSSPSQENLSVEENGCIYSKMIDGGSGKRCLMALDTKEWKMEWIEMDTYEQAARRIGMTVPQYRQYRKEKGHIL